MPSNDKPRRVVGVYDRPASADRKRNRWVWLLIALLAGLAWLVFSALHFAYHVTHLHVYEPLDKWLNVVGQLASILIALAVVLLPPARADRQERAVTPGPPGRPGPS